MRIRIGTRRSALALAQSRLVADCLEKADPQVKTSLEGIETLGDKILDRPLQAFGGKGVFVTELEQMIWEGRLELAVHSAKDMPMELEPGLSVIGVLKREDPRDVLVTMTQNGDLKKATICIGTSSPRRRLQIELLGEKLWPGSKIQVKDLRGNVGTRLRKLEEGQYDGIILAAAGLRRLGLDKEENYRFCYLDCKEMIPAGGQGILAIEGKTGTWEAELCRAVSDQQTWLCLKLERRILQLLEAGCHEPVGVYAEIKGNKLCTSCIRSVASEVFRVEKECFLGQTETEQEKNIEQLAREAVKGLGGL